MNKSVCGKAKEKLKDIETDSVDALASDPPYGLGKANPLKLIHDEELKVRGFMNKEWDVIPDTETLTECCRVLKPGGFALWLFTPRQDCLAVFIYRLMKAGFDTNFTSIYWTYKNGFPKAADISLYIDKREGVEREIIGKVNKTHISNDNTNEGWQRPSHEGRRTMDITLPASEQAKKYQGAYAGFQPKPAVEVIVVSMKPLREKTYLDQALANNGGITWLDDLKVPYRDEKDFDSATYGAPLPDINGGNYIRPKKKQTTPDFRKEGKAVKEVTGQDKRNFNNVSNVERKEYEGDPTGRFPANLIVSDNAIDEGTIKQNGFMDSEKHSRKKSAGKHTASAYGEYDYKTVNTTYGDSGDNSRYFDLDAWFEVMVKKLPPKVQKVFPFFVTPKAAKSEKGKENTHPTVKPIQVVSYMVTMISRPGDTVIDPFAGSGTTGVVCELLGRNSHLIEQDEHYYNNILIPRIEAVTAQGKLF